jgi:hypothetical protein
MSALSRFRPWVFLLFLGGLTDAHFAFGADSSVRQVIVRAPEQRVLNALMKNTDDEALAKLFFAWVADGTATIVSDVSGPVLKGDRTEIRQGALFKNEVGYDQNFDKGAVIPVSWEDVFIGASLEVSHEPHPSALGILDANWQAHFSPRAELSVRWPAWWPDVSEPKVNWFDKHDFFVEKVNTRLATASPGTAILGIMHRADRLDGKAQQDDTVDIVMTQIDSGAKAESSEKPADSHFRGTQSRVMLFGFGLKDSEALDMMNRADLEQDQNLLNELLTRVATGQVKLRTSCALWQRSGNRSTLKTVREHSYPTEMPTIPSAWGMRPVGTRLETEYSFPSSMELFLEHHPAPPRRAEWLCALDMPSFIMWLPQFFVQKVSTTMSFGPSGIALPGAMRTPDCLAGGNDLMAGETLLLFAKLDETAPKPGKETSKENTGGDSYEPLPPRLELEAIVFEVPAAEAQAWQHDHANLGDEERFSKMLAKLKTGTAKVAAHLAVAASSGKKSRLSNVEEVLTVTEVDPPREKSPQRYRPTAMEQIPCGTIWEIEPTLLPSTKPADSGALEMHLQHHLKHHVARPLEPTCQQMISAMRVDESGPLPEAVAFEEAWEGKVTLKIGAARCIGLQHPTGAEFKDRVHVAFLRARMAR